MITTIIIVLLVTTISVYASSLRRSPTSAFELFDPETRAKNRRSASSGTLLESPPMIVTNPHGSDSAGTESSMASAQAAVPYAPDIATNRGVSITKGIKRPLSNEEQPVWKITRGDK
jgi:hypothetical protein